MLLLLDPDSDWLPLPDLLWLLDPDPLADSDSEAFTVIVVASDPASVFVSESVVVPESESELSLESIWWPVITCISNSTNSGKSAIRPVAGFD